MNACAVSDDTLLGLLAEDVPVGDLTTETLGIDGLAARVALRARGAMCACGMEEARRLFELAGAVRCEIFAVSGAQVEAGALLLRADGPAGALHRAWKSAQNQMEWMSGMATAAAAIVHAARPLAVACTRKNVPGTKALSSKAVRAGGAIVHRLGLSETVLVFAEHRLFLEARPDATLRRLRTLQPEKRAVVEVGDADEAMVWAAAGAEILQLEKFPPAAVAALRERLRAAALAPLLIAAGGVGAHNAAAYAEAGADMIATSAPYAAAPVDVAVSFERLRGGDRHA